MSKLVPPKMEQTKVSYFFGFALSGPNRLPFTSHDEYDTYKNSFRMQRLPLELKYSLSINQLPCVIAFVF